MAIKPNLLILLFLFVGLVTSCSDSSTGTDSDPNDSQDPNGAAETTGSLEVTASTSGSGTDEDGYMVSLDDESQSIGSNGSVTFEDLEAGTYSVELSGLDTGCTYEGDNPVSVDVVAGETATVEFEVTCEEWNTEGTIVFTQRVNGVSQIFTMNADGSDIQRITNTDVEETYPAVSPNGEQIVFVRQDVESSTYDYEIWVMDIDGNNQVRLTDNSVTDARPVWSPDGMKIAYESDNQGESLSIFVMDSNGENPEPVTDNGGNDHSPTWSTASNSIAFISNRQGDDSADIYTVQPDGTGLEILIDASDNNGINLFEPDWSPDGSRIAYRGYTSMGYAHIFVADADGSNAELITSEDHSAHQPSWSPDGEYIAFTSLTSGNTTNAIWITKADGSQLTLRLTDNQGKYSAFPSWGPAVE